MQEMYAERLQKRLQVRGSPFPIFPGPDGRWNRGFLYSWQPLKNTRSAGASTEMASGTADIQDSGPKNRGLTWELLLTLTGFYLRAVRASIPPSLGWVSTRVLSVPGPLAEA